MIKKILSFIALATLGNNAIAQTTSFSVPVPPCNNDGVLSLSLTGFTAPVTVRWTTFGTLGTITTHTVTGTTDALTGYSGGPVSVYVTDGTSATFDYYSGLAPFSYTLSVTDAACPTPGSIGASVSGGTAPYTYQWYNKSTGSIITSGSPASLPAGNYGVVITDGAGCQYGSRHNPDFGQIATTSFTATVTTTPANCTNGTASVVAVDPSAALPISYVWSTGATSPTITGLTTGNYHVDIIDANGCHAAWDTGLSGYNVFVPQAVTISIPTTTTPTTCSATDGAIAAFPAGGTAPYSYSWSNGDVTSSPSGLSSGSYFVTVTDAIGCTGQASVFVGSSTPIAVTSSSSPSLCTSNTGNASVVATGGMPPYSYRWYTTPAQFSATATGLPAGTYRFEVTDASGCTQSGEVNVAPVNVINGSFSSTSPLCTSSTGALSISASGGALPYTYLWNNGATTPSLSSISAGNYSVRVTDNMGCRKTFNFNLNSFSPVGVTLSTGDATCEFNNDGTITATPYGGTAPYTYGWSTAATTPSITGLLHGYYSVRVTDALGCTASNNAYLGFDASNTSCYCIIEGRVYNDTNNNCTQDVGENGINHVQILCSGIGYTYTDASGYYSFKVPSGSYTITESLKAFTTLSGCQVNNIPVTATATSGCVLNVDFANRVVPVHNLRVSTSSITPAVPGETYKQRVTIINEGSIIEDSTTLTYKADGQLHTPSFTPSGIMSGSPYFYTSTGIPSLLPGQSQSFIASYYVPTNIPAGTAINFNDTVGYNSAPGAWFGDFTPANNVNAYRTNVVASYDPNYKEVYPKGTGASGIITTADSILEYTVHFQNTGSWYAKNVVVIDTLDSDLNWTSLQPIFETAPCQVSMYQSGPYKIVRFAFHNINLPSQSMDDLRSQGMFTYTIHTNPSLAIGTQIRNKASIYFDYNEPIVTNNTLNTIGAPTPQSIEDVNTSANTVFKLYPNPTTGGFNITIAAREHSNGLITIADMAGKIISKEKIDLVEGSNSLHINLKDIAPGLYLVSLQSGKITETQKLIIIK